MRGDYDRNGGGGGGGGGSDVKSSTGTRVYVGGIGQQVKKDDLEVEFAKYGSISSVWVAYNPPGFAFVEFAERRDAEAACDRLNNAKLFGVRVRVEISRGRRTGGGGGGGRGGQFRDGRRNDRDGGGSRRGGGGGSSGSRGDSYGSSARYPSHDSYSARRYRSRSPVGGRGGGGGEGSAAPSRYSRGYDGGSRRDFSDSRSHQSRNTSFSGGY